MTDQTTSSIARQVRERRVQLMVDELEGIALQLFAEQGFDNVTVEDIATAAAISSRTFYRYFPTKDDVLQVQIIRRAERLRDALSARHASEAPIESLREALASEIAAEDPARLRRWIDVVASSGHAVRVVIGGIQLNTQRVIAEFFAARLGAAPDAYAATVLAAAAQGVIQAAHTQWYLTGGDLATLIADGLAILEHGVGKPNDERPRRRGRRFSGDR